MKREIKFRSWDNINKRIIHDYFFIDSDGNVWYDQDPHGVDMSGKKKILTTDRLTLMQYTGLKDKNGKEVYEGDIVEYHYYHPVTGKQVYRNEIVFDDGKAAFGAEYLDREYHYFGETIFKDACEVIGNIYETKN